MPATNIEYSWGTSNFSQVTLELETNRASNERKLETSAAKGDKVIPNGNITPMPAETVE
jgi:hypothetical protein